jgi:mannose-6-phosphate isomerase-like protein (cupin superfamily)
MEERIQQPDLATEFYTRERCYITELCNAPDDPAASIARARVTPGVSTRWHRLHGTVERYYILEGHGLAEIGSLPPQAVGPGDVVLIPPMCPQRITNTGREDLVFLAICTPRFVDEVYEDIDDGPEEQEE